MQLEQLRARLPDHARDLRINLGALTTPGALSPHQTWVVAVACAITARNAELVAAVEADSNLSPEALSAARGATAIMGMNNVYYRFLHFMGDAAEYKHMPARLRMQIIGNPGIERLDFELACLAASAITGCEQCVRSHEHAVRERGGTKEMVHEAIRIASIIHGVSLALPG